MDARRWIAREWPLLYGLFVCAVLIEALVVFAVWLEHLAVWFGHMHVGMP